jgi:dephospho-CoA kinase
MIIGLTGSIASGKSTVSKMLKERGFAIIDADEVARLVVEPGTETLEKIVNTFGVEMLKEDGTLNRVRLGDRIFGDVKERKKLNDLIHPAIRTEMIHQRDEWIQKGANTIIMDIPLLFESKLQHYVDNILVVSVTEDVQLERLMVRNELTEDEAKSRIRTQLPIKEKEGSADAVIFNNGTLDETENQLKTILSGWNARP